MLTQPSPTHSRPRCREGPAITHGQIGAEPRPKSAGRATIAAESQPRSSGSGTRFSPRPRLAPSRWQAQSPGSPRERPCLRPSLPRRLPCPVRCPRTEISPNVHATLPRPVLQHLRSQLPVRAIPCVPWSGSPLIESRPRKQESKSPQRRVPPLPVATGSRRTVLRIEAQTQERTTRNRNRIDTPLSASRERSGKRHPRTLSHGQHHHAMRVHCLDRRTVEQQRRSRADGRHRHRHRHRHRPRNLVLTLDYQCQALLQPTLTQDRRQTNPWSPHVLAGCTCCN